jgi:hypothetical protein
MVLREEAKGARPCPSLELLPPTPYDEKVGATRRVAPFLLFLAGNARPTCFIFDILYS